MVIGLDKVFIGHSDLLGKRWVVCAPNLEGAVGRIISFCKARLVELEAQNPDKALDMDLKLQEVEDDVMEL